MTKTKETGIDRFHFYIFGIFFFDFPGQSTEIGSPLSGGSIGIDCYFYQNNSPPFLRADIPMTSQKQTSLSLVVTISYRSF